MTSFCKPVETSEEILLIRGRQWCLARTFDLLVILQSKELSRIPKTLNVCIKIHVFFYGGVNHFSGKKTLTAQSEQFKFSKIPFLISPLFKVLPATPIPIHFVYLPILSCECMSIPLITWKFALHSMYTSLHTAFNFNACNPSLSTQNVHQPSPSDP